jgi:receptor expression-enhancing protein 5/6
VESATDFLFYWIPFYHLTKAIFLVWCYLPSTLGAQYIYLHFIEPVLSKYEPAIDQVSAQGRQAAVRVVKDVLAETRNSISASGLPKQNKLADDAKKSLVADAAVEPEGEQ